ncbi:MAG: FliH/SctL family protein [Aquificaceae bacterium]|nr:FliH/SctL family protein [Aquificaceae bacterium]
MEEKSNLLKKLEDKERLDNFMENILNNMLEMLSKEKENAKNEAINFAINILKRLLLADVLPKEEALVRALSKVFESGIDLKGEINLYLNPTDFQRINPYLEKLKERAEGFFSINPMVREELNEGEFIIETQKLWIERRYEDLLQDIIEDMRDERGLQGLS